jgi:probable O-glycosylation ligase (exosortase A-associated)
LNSWQTAINVANARPLVGSGFEMASRIVYSLYAPDRRWPPQVAHSIYFQALGEHGWVGLSLYLFTYFLFWRYASKLIRVTRGRPDLAWAQHYGLMVQVTLIAFAVGGAFLSLILFDVPYYLLMILVVMHKLVQRELKDNPKAETAAGTRQRRSPGHGANVPSPRAT